MEFQPFQFGHLNAVNFSPELNNFKRTHILNPVHYLTSKFVQNGGIARVEAIPVRTSYINEKTP